MDKGTILKILIIFLVTVGAVFWGLNYFFAGTNSHAAGETITYSFSPTSQTVTANQEFHAVLNGKSSATMMIRGYSNEVTFDKSILEVKKIDYKFGTVSQGLGSSDAILAGVNSTGKIKLIGEINTTEGAPMTADTNVSIADVTFKYVGTDATTVTLDKDIAIVYQYKTGGTLVEVPATANASLDINGGGGDPTATPNPDCIERPACALIFPLPDDCGVEPTQGWCPRTTITDDPGGVDVKLNIKLKIQGIANKPAGDLGTLNIKFRLYDENTEKYTDNDGAVFTAADNGIWSGIVDFNNVIPSHKYTFYVKGPFQVQKKICNKTPTETDGGTYRCAKGTITLKAGENDINLSGITLLSGDLPVQDGTISAYDISMIRNNLGSDNSNCDVNRDGKCDTQDYSLLISTLSIKNDEQ